MQVNEFLIGFADAQETVATSLWRESREASVSWRPSDVRLCPDGTARDRDIDETGGAFNNDSEWPIKDRWSCRGENQACGYS